MCPGATEPQPDGGRSVNCSPGENPGAESPMRFVLDRSEFAPWQARDIHGNAPWRTGVLTRVCALDHAPAHSAGRPPRPVTPSLDGPVAGVETYSSVFPPMHHTVAILPDIHLCVSSEPTDGLWMRYRQAPYSPDGEIAAMLDALRGEVRKGRAAPGARRGARRADAGPERRHLRPGCASGDRQRERGPRPAAHRRARRAGDGGHPPRSPGVRRGRRPDRRGRAHQRSSWRATTTSSPRCPRCARRCSGASWTRPCTSSPTRDSGPPAGSTEDLRAALAARVAFRAWFHRTHRRRHRRARQSVRLVLLLSLPDGAVRPESGRSSRRWACSRAACSCRAWGTSTRTSTRRSCSPASASSTRTRYYLFSAALLLAAARCAR